MKKIFALLLVSALMIASVDASAQGKIRKYHRSSDRYDNVLDGFGFSFGYLHSAYRQSDWATEDIDKISGLDGFNIAVTKDFTLIGRTLYIQTGLGYTFQNDSKNNEKFGVKLIGDWDEHFLNIPLKLKYTLPVYRDLEFFATAGPSFVGGLASQLKYRARIGDVNAAYSYNYYSGKIKTNDKMSSDIVEWVSEQLPETRYRRADMQFGCSAGVRFLDFLEAEIGYDWGFVNKYKGQTNDDLKLRRQQFYLTLGLRF